jgi:drug/metabolite transporter superfamily protein YnfA
MTAQHSASNIQPWTPMLVRTVVGVFLTATPIDFGRLLGAYVVLFFLAAQAIDYFAFGVRPSAGIILGGAFIVVGGVIVASSRA